MNNDIFYQIKHSLTMAQVLEHYGQKVHNKKCLCPFHNDSNPSMVVYPTSFYCFVCGVGGDIIKFVSLLQNVSNGEAAKIINSEFMLGLSDEKPSFRDMIKRDRKKEEQQEFSQWIKKEMLAMLDYRRMLWFARFNPDDPLFQESLQNLDTIDYYLDCLRDEPQEFHKNRQVVTNIDRRIHQLFNQRIGA